jgi:riboflavin transporter FmnP
METKTLTTIIVFAAVTIALNPAISGIGFPAFYAPFLIYQIWEIPIVTAFILINRKSAVLISVLNAIVLSAFFPGALPMGPIYNFIAILSTLLGIYLIQIIRKNENVLDTKPNGDNYARSKFFVFATASGIILRVIIMSIVNYIVLRLPYPFGYEVEEFAIVTVFLPPTAIFNASLVLYTIPLGLGLAIMINRYLRLT